MSDKTTIEWCDASWPVVRGCSKVSAGCDNCWAIRDAHLHAGSKNAKSRAHFEGLTVIQNGRPNWNGTVRLDESILDWPLRWKKPRRVFVASSGDLFHGKLSLGSRRRIFDVMREAPQHTYMILTKRAEEMFSFFRWWIQQHVDSMPSNWRPGVSVETQPTADERIPWLLKIPGFHWVSYEPALGPVDWRPYLPALDLIVAGGESGPGARPCDLGWLRHTKVQCAAAGVPLFVKQLGAQPFFRSFAIQHAGRPIPLNLKDRKGGDMAEWPENLRVREYSK